jgi:hypothetical protein
MQSARTMFVDGGSYWAGPGWYWNPYWSMYGFIPGDGIWYSPFGWPFYSPWVIGYGGLHGFGSFGARHVSAGAVASRGLGVAHVGGGFSSHGFAGGMRGSMGGGRR